LAILTPKSVERVCRLLQFKEYFDIVVESTGGKVFQKASNGNVGWIKICVAGYRKLW